MAHTDDEPEFNSGGIVPGPTRVRVDRVYRVVAVRPARSPRGAERAAVTLLPYPPPEASALPDNPEEQR